jgi:hypothetical protein
VLTAADMLCVVPRLRLALLACLPVLGACFDGEELASEESDLTQTLTLRFEATDDGLALRASNKPLTCSERFDGLAGERVTCSRKGERVQVIVKDGGSVVAVRDLSGKRGYYTCTPSGEVDGLPAAMKCKATKLRPRGTGGLSSPFDASVAGVSLPNTHAVDEAGQLLRGMEPRTPEQIAELREAGVEKVVIFKNMTGGAVIEEEVAAWGLPEGSVLHVPFLWKDLPDFRTPCEQTIEALRFVRDAEKAGEKAFVHCTVGEDRTGYLAAMHGLIFESADPREAFDLDMCERGYASGNPQKPGFVIGELDEHVTPLYRAMAYLVAEGVLTAELDPSVCATEPEVPESFLGGRLSCGVSTTLVP